MRIHITRLRGGGLGLGGAEQSAILHARILTELRHEAVLYSNLKADVASVRNIWIPANKLLRWAWSWLLFPWLAVLSRADILNPHSREDQITLTLTKWLHRTPVVWKDPGDLVHQIWLERKSLLGRLNQRLLIAAIKRADAIYALNSDEKEMLFDKLTKLGHEVDDDKFKVIPSDILFDEYDLNARPPKKTDKLVIGTLSRLDTHKGVQYLLQACKNLIAIGKNFELWVVGDGAYRSELENLAAGMDATFWGHQVDISPFLVRMDIFVQPAEIEGWGRNVKEARYFGKAVIGSNVGGIAVQIKDGETGLLFEPKNVNELEKKLAMLIEDKRLRAKLGAAAKADALAEGDFRDLVKDKILPLFKSVAQKSK